MTCESRNTLLYHQSYASTRRFLAAFPFVDRIRNSALFVLAKPSVFLFLRLIMGFLKVVVTFIWELTTLTPQSLNPFSYDYDNGQQHIIPPSHDSPSVIPWKPGTARLTFPVDGISSTLMCEYDLDPAVWEPCNTPENRLCWLQNKQTGENYTINTDCELLDIEEE
jgi:hypothetical protein